MFNAHPNVLTIPFETGMFFSNGDPQRTVARWMERGRATGAKKLCEKTPMHVRYVDRIRAAFPHARIILMMRDGRDVVRSLRRRDKNLDHACARWVNDNRAGLDAKLPVIRYEDLIARPADTLARACELAGVDYDPAMLAFHNTEHDWFKSGHADQRKRKNEQLRTPLFDDRGSFSQLPQEEQEFVERRLADALREFGYV